MKIFAANLDIKSYTYIGSIGAEHFYGEIKFPKSLEKEDIELLFSLTQKEASYLNKKGGSRGVFDLYKKGDLSNKFDTEGKLIRFGIKLFKKDYPDNLLLKGDSYICSALHLLYWPKALDKLAKRVNILADEYKKLPWSEGFYQVCLDEKKMNKINREWDELMKPYLI